MAREGKPGSDADRRPQRQPAVLPPQWLDQVSGGLNPQPLPPCHELRE